MSVLGKSQAFSWDENNKVKKLKSKILCSPPNPMPGLKQMGLLSAPLTSAVWWQKSIEWLGLSRQRSRSGGREAMACLRLGPDWVQAVQLKRFLLLTSYLARHAACGVPCSHGCCLTDPPNTPREGRAAVRYPLKTQETEAQKSLELTQDLTIN